MLRERAFHVDHKSLCVRYEHTYECANNFFRADTITYIIKRIVGGWEGDFCFASSFCLCFQFNMCIFFLFFIISLFDVLPDSYQIA